MSMVVPTNAPLKDPGASKTYTKCVLRGWMFKRGRIRKTWKRRYFVLCMPDEGELFAGGVGEPCLVYFKESPDVQPNAKPQGTMSLVACCGATEVPKEDKPLRFMVEAGGRQLYLQAGNLEAMQQWISALNGVAAAFH